jgi:hypothetical protein
VLWVDAPFHHTSRNANHREVHSRSRASDLPSVELYIMPDSLLAPEVKDAIRTASTPATRSVLVNGAPTTIEVPFPSPTDWRDVPIYFVLLDRFNNPGGAPAHTWDQPFDRFQGGTFEGVRQKLGYIADIGFRGLWLSPPHGRF